MVEMGEPSKENLNHHTSILTKNKEHQKQMLNAVIDERKSKLHNAKSKLLASVIARNEVLLDSVPSKYASDEVKFSLKQKRKNMMARALQTEIRMKVVTEWTMAKVQV